ncbi:MAG: AAA domain-containing protein, partial [Candidatus Nealsonbacteria bacterium]|nr:AAA domain-containing protein [Candidatus Nealsonbacteria bacterium]
LPSLLSYTESVKGSGDLLEIVFNEILSAGNIILVIPDLHHYAGGKVSAGAIDISAVLGPYLNLSEFKLIATTSFRGLHKYIEQNPSLLNLFEKVEVVEPPESKILIILQNVAARLEAKYDKFISYQALRDVISYAEKYIQDVPFPKKAVDLLEDTVVCVSQKKEDIVLPKHVAEVVHRKTEIPVGKIEKEEKDVLLNLEELIHQRIINQETAVKKISEALRRARSEISIRDAPMGSFLFLGPTGVGKTETSKSLAEIYFGSEDKMIRLDMSEFQNTEDIARLIGSPGEEGLLTTEVRENPFSLVLLDEIEKAHPKILNLFLQVLDEGHITDGLGRKVNFKNTIIIATSNAGYRLILQALKEEKNISEIKDELFDYLFQEGYFRPEFINRFDAVVIFEALSKENLLDIADLLLKKLKKNLAKKDITFQVTKELKEKIVGLSYDPKFGAREMKRVVQDNIGNVVATALLSDQIEAGDTIEIEPEGFNIKKK